jgi:hypothetical protein
VSPDIAILKRLVSLLFPNFSINPVNIIDPAITINKVTARKKGNNLKTLLN